MVDIAIQYKEVLVENHLHFIPVIAELNKLPDKFGHKEIEANGFLVEEIEGSDLVVGSEIDFVMLNTERISLKP